MSLAQKTALLLIAHGSRRAEANQDLEHVAVQIAARNIYPIIHLGYLELTKPSIEEGGVRCIESGADRVIMLPYFLSPGIHVREDLQEAREILAARFPQAEFHLAEPLGRHPGLIDIVLERASSI